MAGCLLFLATRERLLLRAFCMELTGGSSHIGHPTNRVSELCHENRLPMAWGMGLWLVMVEFFFSGKWVVDISSHHYMYNFTIVPNTYK